MLNYIGTKAIKATPMNLGDYNKLQGWVIPEGQDPATEGYLVEYQDGGKANHKDFAGYISWSPKDVFERAYKRTETFLDRMRVEYTELQDKVDKLHEFISKPKPSFVDDDEWERLKIQYGHMNQYQWILGERINAAVAKAV